jgi:UDPglucose 6-dehydrogenase
VRNCFLATKVSFFNGIEKFCGVNDVSYEFVRELVCLDERVGESHTEVPGPDGKRGFGGTCFPKDLNSLIYQMDQSNVDPMILSAANDQNNKVDRPEKDWEEDRGRAVSF